MKTNYCLKIISIPSLEDAVCIHECEKLLSLQDYLSMSWMFVNFQLELITTKKENFIQNYDDNLVISTNNKHPLIYQTDCELYEINDHYYMHFNKLKFKSKKQKLQFLNSSLKSLQ